MKKLGVRLGGSATSQQVLKMKIDGGRKREATPAPACRLDGSPLEHSGFTLVVVGRAMIPVPVGPS